MRLHGLERLIALVLLLLSAASCGKKGPPRIVPPVLLDGSSNLSAIHRESDIVLSWTPAPGGPHAVSYYEVLRASGQGGFAPISRTKAPAYTDKDTVTGGVYRYMVRSVGPGKTPGRSSNVLEIEPLQSPARPEGLSFSIGRDAVRIGWEHPEVGRVLFNIYKCGSDSVTPTNAAPLEVLSFTLPPSPEAEICLVVRPLLGGPLRDEGPASDEIRITPADYVPSAPAGLVASGVDGRVVLSWKEPPEPWVRGYEIQRAVGDGEFAIVGTSATPAFTDTVDTRKRILYRIRALGPSAGGVFSDTVRVGPSGRKP